MSEPSYDFEQGLQGDELQASLALAQMLQHRPQATPNQVLNEEIRGILAVDLYLIARK